MTNFDDFLSEQMKDPVFKSEWDAFDGVRTALCVAPFAGFGPAASALIARLEAALYKSSISAICKPTLLPTIEKLACDGDRHSTKLS